MDCIKPRFNKKRSYAKPSPKENKVLLFLKCSQTWPDKGVHNLHHSKVRVEQASGKSLLDPNICTYLYSMLIMDHVTVLWLMEQALNLTSSKLCRRNLWTTDFIKYSNLLYLCSICKLPLFTCFCTNELFSLWYKQCFVRLLIDRVISIMQQEFPQLHWSLPLFFGSLI